VTSARRLRVARLILAGMPETIQVLAQKYSIQPQVLQKWAARLGMAPQAELILTWAVQQWEAKQVRLPEDFPRLVQAATFLAKGRGNAKLRQLVEQHHPGKNSNNLLAFTLHEVEDLEQQQAPRVKPLEERPPAGAKILAEKNGLRVVEVTTPEAACELSRGSKWCTSDEATAQQYLQNGALYVVYKRGQKVAQVHLDSGQLMDLRDRPIAYTQFPELFDLLDETGLLQKSTLSLEHPKYDDDEHQVENLLEGTDHKHSLGPQHSRSKALAQWALRDPNNAYLYARNVVEGPWPEGEFLIAQDARHAVNYAQYITHQRFPAGEPEIMRSPAYAGAYAGQFLGGHWPEAEAFHAREPGAHSRYHYTLNLKKGPA